MNTLAKIIELFLDTTGREPTDAELDVLVDVYALGYTEASKDTYRTVDEVFSHLGIKG